MARTLNTVLNKSVENGHPWLVPDLKENNLSFSQFKKKCLIFHDESDILYLGNPEKPPR